MILLSAQHITKRYVERPLLQDASFFLNEGDRVGLIGVNGTGKSTLLQILAGCQEADAGELVSASGVTVSYLPQVPVLQAHCTILEQVLQGTSAQLQADGAYRAKAILGKLGIPDTSRDCAQLSGGEKRRVAIAAALLHPCDVLILDEPTNHVDNETVLWLEDYLSRYTGALVMVTHDRYFLDRVANRIVELDGGKLYGYETNFTGYLEQKAQREAMEQSTERKNRSLYRTELAWMQRGVRARGTKSKSRMDRFETLRTREQPKAAETLELSSVASRLGRKTIELCGISKQIQGRQLFSPFDHLIARDARIGIVGANGSGKTTLLKLIAGTMQPDTGSVVIGETVKIGYFSQECEEMDTSLRVIDYIRETADYIETADGRVSASQLLETFLFPPQLQWNRIAQLSGGERKRLYLLKILAEAPNVLLLDEPTNDLDIPTLCVLEQFIRTFCGAVLAVSHDRYFLDKIADEIWDCTGDGEIRRYLGGYSDYLALRAMEPSTAPEKQKPAQPVNRHPAAPKKLKFSFREQRDFETIDAQLAELEAKHAALEQEISDNARDYVKLQALLADKATLEQELEEKMERWLYLQDLAEQIARQ